MANVTQIKRSYEEILDQTARIIAGTINVEKMGIAPEEVDVENFIKYFKQYLSHLLSLQEAVHLAIGTAVNGDFCGVYSYGMQYILDHIEEEMHIQFHFYHGVALWICKNELYAVWLPH